VKAPIGLGTGVSVINRDRPRTAIDQLKPSLLSSGITSKNNNNCENDNNIDITNNWANNIEIYNSNNDPTIKGNDSYNDENKGGTIQTGTKFN